MRSVCPDISLAVMVHIVDRHGERSKNKNSSKFNCGWTTIEELIKDTAALPDVVKIVGESRTLYEKEYPRVIGWKSSGVPSTRLRVVTNAGQLVTAYSI
jgi:hypothetical protein